MVARTFSNLFGFIKEKSVPIIDPIVETTRDGLPKAYIPKFIYKPPFGYPRFVDLPNIRRLAATPYVEMCISTILDEICAVEWNILPIEGKETAQTEAHIEHVENFFKNPNTNKESYEKIRRKYLRDVLEVDAGVIIKMFNPKLEMVEIVARDGSTFTKNPDIFGMITDREDFIIEPNIDFNLNKAEKEARLIEPRSWISSADAREKAAYFQYGWISGARPVPFGKRELIWMERNPRTDNIYGRSAVENLATTIQTLIYAIEENLEYFNDNSIPKGILGFEGLDSEGLKAFREQWREQQRKKDSAGNWKKNFHNLPFANAMPKFERIQFTNSELELLEGQKWWAKLVWACFGVTAVELGYTEDAKGLANQIVQSNIFRKRSIYPLLRLEEYHINKEIIATEFEYDDIEFKFNTFDVDEETKKASLYQLQLNSGYRSVNEIRVEEGLEEVEWGEKQSQEEMLEMQNKFSDNESNGSNEKEEGNEKKKTKEDNERMNGKKEKEKKESKSNVENNPLILRENEIMDEDRLRRSIIYLMKDNEEKIKALITKEAGANRLQEIKSIESIAKAIKGLLNFTGLKTISDSIIRNTFMKGWDNAEKQLDKNLLINKPAITFLQEYTFENIKGMTEEIMEDLRQELQRGIIAGESVTEIKNRVSKVFDVGENRAEMIARTETNRAENQGKLQAFKSSGEKYKKRWDTHFDGRTSAICKRLDGQVVNMNENFEDKTSGWKGPAPPSHVNCRSSVLFITQEELEKKAREEEKSLIDQELREQKLIDEKIDSKLREKETEIKTRKEELLKRLEVDRNGGNTDLSRQGKE